MLCPTLQFLLEVAAPITSNKITNHFLANRQAYLFAVSSTRYATAEPAHRVHAKLLV